MTLVKYWVSKYNLAPFDHTKANWLPTYLCADVDKVVEENDALQRDLNAQLDENKQLQADLARVTAELEKAKEYISSKHGLGIPYPVTGEIASAQRQWKGDKP